jgi:hypothetical protein
MKHFKISFILLYFLASKICGQQLGIYSIEGKTLLSSNIKQITLYKYKSVFELEFIANLDINNKVFFYTANLNEPDIYLIENPTDKKFKSFVWDKNIEIIIHSDNISEAVILNSPLDTEKDRFDSSVQSQFFDPIRQIDTLISNLKIINDAKNQNKIDSLVKERNKKIDWSKKEYANFKKKYIINNKNSFYSLLLLTFTGSEPMDEENRILFEGLSPILKNHSRAKIYYSPAGRNVP